MLLLCLTSGKVAFTSKMTKEHGFNGKGNGVLSDDDICDVMTIYFNGHDKMGLKILQITWLARPGLPSYISTFLTIEDQLYSNSNLTIALTTLLKTVA